MSSRKVLGRAFPHEVKAIITSERAEECRRWTHALLTKGPKNMQDYLYSILAEVYRLRGKRRKRQVYGRNVRH